MLNCSQPFDASQPYVRGAVNPNTAAKKARKRSIFVPTTPPEKARLSYARAMRRAKKRTPPIQTQGVQITVVVGQDLFKALRLTPGYKVIMAAHNGRHFTLNYCKFSIT